MKKYQIGGSMQSKTSDELNPYKIKTPVAPNPSFVPSGSMDKAQQGVEKKENPKLKFKTSEYFADNYSVDTTGLAKGSSNYYPYTRGNGTKGVFTKAETKTILDKIKKGTYKKSKY